MKRCRECEEYVGDCYCSDDNEYNPDIEIINEVIEDLKEKPKTPSNIYDSAIEVLKRHKMMAYQKLIKNIIDFILFIYPNNNNVAKE